MLVVEELQISAPVALPQPGEVEHVGGKEIAYLQAPAGAPERLAELAGIEGGVDPGHSLVGSAGEDGGGL